MGNYILYFGIYILGLFTGLVFMFFGLKSKNSKLNSYKRELEKEAISGEESSSRVKVLEAKIEVLEKALESALKK